MLKGKVEEKSEKERDYIRGKMENRTGFQIEESFYKATLKFILTNSTGKFVSKEVYRLALVLGQNSK